jgi:hypothetical protein
MHLFNDIVSRLFCMSCVTMITDGESGEFGKKQFCVNCCYYPCVRAWDSVVVKVLRY